MRVILVHRQGRGRQDDHRRGHRRPGRPLGDQTLVMSTDAAHSLGDALDVDLAPRAAPSSDDREVEPGLYALAGQRAALAVRSWRVVQDYLLGVLAAVGVDAGRRRGADLAARGRGGRRARSSCAPRSSRGRGTSSSSTAPPPPRRCACWPCPRPSPGTSTACCPPSGGLLTRDCARRPPRPPGVPLPGAGGARRRAAALARAPAARCSALLTGPTARPCASSSPPSGSSSPRARRTLDLAGAARVRRRRRSSSTGCSPAPLAG